jgi:hypothetical protein
MSYQEIQTKEYYAAEVDELLRLPQPCVHQDLLEAHRNASYGVRRREGSVECPSCHQHVRDDAPLRAKDAPALVHAIIFYGTFYLVYKLLPYYDHMFLDLAMWIAWVAAFVYNFATRTPLRAVRNAALILFAIDTVMVYGHFWADVTMLDFSQTLLRAVNSFLAALIAVSPIFVSFGIHALIDRLKANARAER